MPARTRLDLVFFDPSAERARRLDARMRERLGESLRYVVGQAAEHLPIPTAALDDFFARLKSGPVGPQAFGAYFDLVLAIEADALDEAAARLAEIVAQPKPGPGLRVVDLADPARDAPSDRYCRQVDTDPTAPFEILPPPPALAAACRRRIDEAFALLDAGNPALGAEIRGLVREIVLAVGPSGPGAVVFDGASSFMLWGAVVLNAASHETPLAMLQALAHESGHNLLFGLAADGPLVENPDDERYASPLRADPRPLDGIFHATFVLARMHQALARLRDAGVLAGADLEEADAALAWCSRLFADGLGTVERHARLTPMGAAVLAGARDYMASV